MFIYPIYNHNWRNIGTIYVYIYIYRGADKSLALPEGNKLKRQKILSFVYPIYNHNWRNISTIYVHIYRGADKSLARPGRKQATTTEDFDVHISHL
jgi:uncharacterized protein involved in tellurium resistance